MKIDSKSHIEEPNVMIVGKTTFVAVEKSINEHLSCDFGNFGGKNHCNRFDCSLHYQCGNYSKRYNVWKIVNGLTNNLKLKNEVIGI